MTLPASGTISIASIHSEFDIQSGVSFTDRDFLSDLGALHEVLIAPGSPISMSNFYGKTKAAPVYAAWRTFNLVGSYYETLPAVTIGPNGYVLNKVAVDPTNWTTYVDITRPIGSANTTQCRRVKINDVTDVSRASESFETTVTSVLYGGTNRRFVWDHAWSITHPATMVNGGSYYLQVWADTFN